MLKSAQFVIPVVLLSAGAVFAAIPKSYMGARYVLTLDGKTVGALASAEGGTLVGDVVSDREPGFPFSKKQLGKTEHEDLTIQLGFDGARHVYHWIDSAWTGSGDLTNGALSLCTFDNKPAKEHAFDATLSEVTFPELSTAEAKAVPLLTLKLKPSSFNSRKESDACSAPQTLRKGQGFVSGFRFELDGVDATGVRSIGSFTVSTAAVSDGSRREEHAVNKARVTFPNLELSVSAEKAASFEKWFEDFVVNGNNDDSKERGGAIVLVDRALKEVARVSLENVGITRFAPKAGKIGEGVNSVSVGLYVERMRLSMDGAAPSAMKVQATQVKRKPEAPRKKRAK